MVKRLTNPLAERPPPLGTLFGAAARRLGAELDAGMAEAGFADLRAAHAPVFQAIDAGGSRLTQLAARTGMSKQAAGELVRYLEQRGYVTVTAAEDDGRAKQVRLTAKGWRAVDAGIAVIDAYDARLEQAVGGTTVAQLRAALLRIIGDEVGLSGFAAAADDGSPTA